MIIIITIVDNSLVAGDDVKINLTIILIINDSDNDDFVDDDDNACDDICIVDAEGDDNARNVYVDDCYDVDIVDVDDNATDSYVDACNDVVFATNGYNHKC